MTTPYSFVNTLDFGLKLVCGSIDANSGAAKHLAALDIGSFVPAGGAGPVVAGRCLVHALVEMIESVTTVCCGSPSEPTISDRAALQHLAASDTGRGHRCRGLDREAVFDRLRNGL